ncbi:HCL105Cp [Eremothecium sinecaudum]|uniref:Non-structural maintenance of chromosomes element 4 n=1 Tax=Eremothecium sinecaudum TaxID=45286 RepID=A0A0X8HRD0_9SACH|nr:HCL105Cp [Eremothecium sinecaudum]AMD20046.1 HCL105Cp [Eremothecium sinecaudum]
MVQEHNGVKKRRLDDSVERIEDSSAVGVEFQILQGYRNFEDEVVKDRASAARTGDIDLAMQRLDEVNALFNQAGGLNSSANTLYAQDSHAVMSVSELASISVRNLKLNSAGKVLNVDDMINAAKRYMLEDYFEINRIPMPSAGPEPTAGDDSQANKSEDDTSDQEENEFHKCSRQSQKNELQTSYLGNFEEYREFSTFNWLKMGTLFQNLSKMPATVDHMLGPLAIQKKQRVVTQRREMERVGQKITAEAVTNDSLNDNQSETTPEQVKKCFQVLMSKNGYKRINLFKFIIDPNSFARSIEHLFYTSFLIKEGRLVLEDDENGYPAVRPKEPLPSNPNEKEIERQRRTDAQQKHIIFQMDMPTWRKLIDKFKITESFLP